MSGLMLAWAGCGNAGSTCTVRGAPEAQVGTATLSGAGFVPLTDGDRVPLTFGIQGGFHVWTNVRTRNLCFEGVHLQRKVTTADTGEEVITIPNDFSLVAADEGASEGWGQLPIGQPTFLCPHMLSGPLVERPLRVTVTVTDAQGRIATDARTLVPFCPANADQQSCAMRCAPAASDGGT